MTLNDSMLQERTLKEMRRPGHLALRQGVTHEEERINAKWRRMWQRAFREGSSHQLCCVQLETGRGSPETRPLALSGELELCCFHWSVGENVQLNPMQETIEESKVETACVANVLRGDLSRHLGGVSKQVSRDTTGTLKNWCFRACIWFEDTNIIYGEIGREVLKRVI